MATFNFIGGAYQARSKNIDSQRCVNLYAELDQTGKSTVALYGTPGKVRKVTPTNGPCRGSIVFSGYLFVVIGSGIYKIDTSWSSTLIGTLLTSSGRVSMAQNGQQIMLVDGTYGYTCSTTTLSQIVNGSFPDNPQVVSFQDGYFVVNRGNTQQFYISTLYDGTGWDALDFGSSEGYPDKLISLISDHRELWLFGETTVEVFYNSGNADFPFERISGAYIETGCAAPFSVAKMDNSVFWLSRDDRGNGIVYRANGYQPVRVSTHAIEYAISTYSVISDAFAYTYQQEGHAFYVLTFPTESKTWTFDVSTNLWHERAYTDSEGNLKRDRSNCYSFFNGYHVVGDWENGKIYTLDPDVYDDDGDEISSIRACQHLSSDLKNQFFHELQIDLEAGVGLEDGTDPQISLRWSDDGGHTWSNEHFRSMGKIGEYKKRARWTRLGKSRDRIFEAKITDKVKRVLIGASSRVTVGVY